MPRTNSIARRLTLGLKALRQMVFNPWGGASANASWFGSISGFSPSGSNYDFVHGMGDPATNPAVAACLRVICDNVGQPRMQVTEEDAQGDRTPVAGAPLPKLFRRPNPHRDYYSLMDHWIGAAILDGNGYLIKVRSGAGIPVELWWVPSSTMTPRWPIGDPSILVSYWEYNPGGGQTYRIDPADVIHLTHGREDPCNSRLMISPLRAAAARTICSLNEADGFTATLMRHGGVPPIVLKTTVPNQYPTEDDARAMAAGYRSLLDGGRKGDPFIPLGPFEPAPLGFNPEQLALDRIPSRLEDQVCALLGVPAMLVGLTSGAQHKTYANVAEARRSFYEETLIPLLARVASCLEKNLLGDPGMGDPETQQIGFSYADIQCLQEDRDALATRVVALYQGGVYTRGKALRALGDDADDNDDLYVVTRGQQFLRVGEGVPPFAPPNPEPGKVSTTSPAQGGSSPAEAGAKAIEAKAADDEADDEADTDPLLSAKTLEVLESDFSPEGEDGTGPFPVEVEAKAADPAPDPDEPEARLLLAEARRLAGVPPGAGTYTEEEKRATLHAIVEIASTRMREMAEGLRESLASEEKGLIGDAAAKVKAWKDNAAKFLRRAFLAGVLALSDPMTTSDAEVFDSAFQAQVEYLDRFEEQLLGEDVETGRDGFVSRSASYGAATWLIAENVAANHAIDGGASEGRRFLGGGDHCSVCPGLADLGWVPAADVVPVGQTPCGSRCRCWIEWR